MDKFALYYFTGLITLSLITMIVFGTYIIIQEIKYSKKED